MAWIALAPRGEARLQPYYVIKTNAENTLQSRVLFVIDSSGWMSLEAQTTDTLCSWQTCEASASAGTTNSSRIAAVRRAVNGAVTSAGTTTKFALMTFDQRSPWTASPSDCNDLGEPTRFVWVDSYNLYAGFSGGPLAIDRESYTGAWRICEGSEKRSYPYLRWDDLGVGSVVTADDQTGSVPSSPLISTAQADMTSISNAERKVQFFPRFLGVRVNLGDTNDADRSILYSTYGDYGDDDATRDTEVWNQDFYYWPYVDGFPGYAQWSVTPPHDGTDAAGIVSEDSTVDAATLYAPFYLQLPSTVTDTGPASFTDALDAVLDLTSPMMEGGIDVVGSTPWAGAIGSTSTSPPNSNAAFSHTSVASYLSWVTTADTPDVCAPTSAVLVAGSTADAGQDGSTLFGRLADLRNQLGVKVYVVSFLNTSTAVNNAACAAAGACSNGTCTSPCDDDPADAWDTCADPDNPGTSCAYFASTEADLSAAFADILDATSKVHVQSGPGTAVNQFDVGGSNTVIQTEILGYTEVPGWKGHVTRAVCDDVDGDGNLLPSCTVPADFAFDPREGSSFGPCPQSLNWDAGECLQQTTWTDRRLYSYTADLTPYLIANSDGTASGTFESELLALGVVSGTDSANQADALAAFLLGRDAPGGWKLAGLADSAPTVIRRIPQYEPNLLPTVNIRDPHCSGRLFSLLQRDSLPVSLRDFAKAAWSDDNLVGSPDGHFEYQEGVLVGDDMGVLHAFQLSSGNELWGVIPRELLMNAKAEADVGAATMGEPSSLSDHVYGVGSTPNAGWVYDDGGGDSSKATWRHLVVTGFGPGGTEYIALDASHMAPDSSAGPVDVRWTTESSADKANYDDYLGETWARPALTYWVPNDDVTQLPVAKLVLGSGYPRTGAATTSGRTLMFVDAVTGDIIEHAELPDITTPLYESTFGEVVDLAVGTNCLSDYWGEAEETYVADPAGRLFRWDLGRNTAHESDSGGLWGTTAIPLATFTACTGTGDTCTIDPSANPADPFLFAPAYSANDRIDDVANLGSAPQGIDQFLVALVSGSPDDDSTDPTTSDFHTSLYVLADDHHTDKSAGMNIPTGAPKSTSGPVTAGTALTSDPGYIRLAVTDIQRTREYTSFADGSTITETRNFSRQTRAVRSPRIFVTGVVDRSLGTEPTILQGVEVYYVTFTLYEPGSDACDPSFYSATTGWHPDPGAVYELTFRLTANAVDGFDFSTGAGSGSGVNFGAGFQAGMTLSSVEQVSKPDLSQGLEGTGPNPGVSKSAPCDNNASGSSTSVAHFAIPMRSGQIKGFTPLEN